MRISHRHKFIFIAISKTASTSIRHALTPYSDVLSSSSPPFYHHAKAIGLKTEFEKNGWNWADYFSFCFVRNPWDRVVSQYFYALRDDLSRLSESDLDSGWRDHCHFVRGLKSFEDYVHACHVLPGWQEYQLSWCVDEKRNSLVSFIGRYEFLDQDFQKITEQLNLPNLPLPKLDANDQWLLKPNHAHYQEYYNPDSRRIIEHGYADDIAYFGYKF